MTAVNESSHARNAANFHLFTEKCATLGAAYNPTNPLITLDALRAYYTGVKEFLGGINETEIAFNDATARRKEAFKGLNPFATRIVNALESGGARASKVKEARTQMNKFKGTRVTEPKAAPGEQTAERVSVSQLSYDNRTANFQKLVQIVLSERGYGPNEEALKPGTLTQKLALLTSTNEGLATFSASYSQELLKRDELLYHPEAGIVARATAIRKYIASVFGAGSPEAKLFEGIHFRTLSKQKPQVA